MVTILVLAVLLEIGARIVLPFDTANTHHPRRDDGGLGTIYEPNGLLHRSNGLDFGVTQQANEAGFADRPLPEVAKPEGRCRIALFGDSYVEALQVPIAQKLQVLLETRLEAEVPGLDVETMAFGQSGAGQIAQLPYFDILARPRQPDVLVLVFVNNDVRNNSPLLEAITQSLDPRKMPFHSAWEGADGVIRERPPAKDWRQYRLPILQPREPRLHVWLSKSSRFYRWVFAKLSLQYPKLARLVSVKRRPTQWSANVGEIDKRLPGTAKMLGHWDPLRGRNLARAVADPDASATAFAQAFRLTEYGFSEFKRRADAAGMDIVVLGSHGVRGRHAQHLRAMLERLKIPYLSQRAYIKALGEPVARARWRHDSHWSPQGHIWAAEQLTAHLLARGFCGRPPARQRPQQ